MDGRRKAPPDDPLRAAIQAAARDLALSEPISERLVRRIHWHLHRLAGGDHLYVRATDPERNTAIRAAWRAGQPPCVLALRFGLTESRIRQICRRPKESPRD